MTVRSQTQTRRTSVTAATSPESGSAQVPAYARVCQQLRQDILGGLFPWGGRLKIAELVRRYGVSQMPIREALQKLQGEGLITIQPNCGACVRVVDEKFIADIYDLRGAIDTMLIRRATARATDSDLRAMEIILETHEQAERRGELNASLEYNKQFHRVIYRMADNPDATEVIERYWDLIDAMRRQFGFSAGFMSTVIGNHRRLLNAIVDRDADAAIRIAAESCDRSKDDLIQQMRAGRQSASDPKMKPQRSRRPTTSREE
jgi:DNA-binding GntR family transcriptional regulator